MHLVSPLRVFAGMPAVSEPEDVDVQQAEADSDGRQ